MERPLETVSLSLVTLAVLGWALPIALPAPYERSLSGACVLPSDPSQALPITTLQQCRSLEPQNVEIIVALAAAYEAAGDDVSAEHAFRHAVELDPEHADARLALARVLLSRGDYAEAEFQATAGLHTHPNRAALLNVVTEARTAGRRERQ